MSGRTWITNTEDGEETTFKCLAIGHFFKKHMIDNDYSYFVSVKTGPNTMFDLTEQKGHRWDPQEKVLRVHNFEVDQTIED